MREIANILGDKVRVFKSKIKNLLYFTYRMINPVCDILKLVQTIPGYLWFLRDFVKYKLKDSNAKLLTLNLYPKLTDKTSFTPFDAHYFYQQLWVFENVFKTKPALHVDIGSTYQMSGYISKIVRTKFIDIRPIDVEIENLFIEQGSILKIPAEDSSIESLSCLHVIEHVGLGRYGDPIDPEGTQKASSELKRVLAKNGLLYIALPIGRDRICFNAHRVISPHTIINYFEGLKLLEFSVVDDIGKFIRACNWRDYEESDYCCGMFFFTKA